jgi:hypothetical protein
MKPVIDIVLEGHHASGETENEEKDGRSEAQIEMDSEKYRAGWHAPIGIAILVTFARPVYAASDASPLS